VVDFEQGENGDFEHFKHFAKKALQLRVSELPSLKPCKLIGGSFQVPTGNDALG
jgi:hypothetical protein